MRSAGARGRELARDCARLDVQWARRKPARYVREAIINGLLGPVMDLYVKRRTIGREHFEALRHPVVFVANHASHMDTPAILRALPLRWRQRTTVAAAADYFYRWRWSAVLVTMAFNTVPIARRGGGKESMEHLGRLLDQRWNLLLYPEGTRSRDGEIGRLRSGAALLASEHDMAVMPIYVTGTRDAMPPGRVWPRWRRGRFWPRRHVIEVHFGAPIFPGPGEDAHAVNRRVRAFLEREGARSGELPRPGSTALDGHGDASGARPASSGAVSAPPLAESLI